MKNTLKLYALVIVAGLMLAPTARADFGEIDLLARESVENFFVAEARSVDMTRFEYVGEPKWVGSVMEIETSVWAETHRLPGGVQWAYHNCWTQIEVSAPGRYLDLGTVCELDFD
ncbi:MAG TPA: hypothetical protein PLZ57_05280 [Pseudobdellovibrionaceae bacterium]|nr:hypothetical protein [Pseudobdellovibrionaceae bacterium]